MDQGAYGQAIGASAESISASRCSSVAGLRRMNVPVFLGRPKGLRQKVLKGGLSSMVRSVEQGRPSDLRRLVHEIDKTASSSVGDCASSGTGVSTGLAASAEFMAQCAVQGSAFVGKRIRRACMSCRRTTWVQHDQSTCWRWTWALIMCVIIALQIGWDTVRGVCLGAYYGCRSLY